MRISQIMKKNRNNLKWMIQGLPNHPLVLSTSTLLHISPYTVNTKKVKASRQDYGLSFSKDILVNKNMYSVLSKRSPCWR